MPAQRLMLEIHGQNFGDLSQSYNAETPFQLLVGNEGGLTDREIEQAHAAGFTGFQLGPRTLRMETAATSITALIQHYFGDLR